MATSHSRETPSTRVVYVALLGNALVAASKFVAAAFTGSSAMLSEGVHSLVDTTNELVLLYGMRRATAQPDHDHPLGYGREVYFWSFVVAVLVFTLGAGVSAYEGVLHIAHPRPIENPHISYIVLGMAALFEGTSWGFTLRRLKGDHRIRQLPALIIRSKDPPTFIVFLEDSAALVGVAIAFAGIWISATFGEPAADGAASVLVGVVLGCTAWLLARETKGLLIGEAASKGTRDSILQIAQSMEGIAHANGVLSVHMAPEEIMAALSIEFEDSLHAPQIEACVVELEHRIREKHPSVTAVFIKPQTAARYEKAQARSTL